MKDTYYFQHDYNARGDLKIQAMLIKWGALGYGLYWCIIEMLHEESASKLPCEKFVYDAIAQQMQCKSMQVQDFIKDCNIIYKLFLIEDNHVISDRVLQNKEKRRAISSKRSEAASKRWSDANAMQKDAKERKGNKSKRKFIAPTLDEFREYCNNLPYKIDIDNVFHGYNDADWYDSKGNEIKSWKQKVRQVWCQSENKKPEKPKSKSFEELVNEESKKYS